MKAYIVQQTLKHTLVTLRWPLLTDQPDIFLSLHLCRKSCLTHMPSSTSCSSSLWRPCSLSASCLFSATICGSWERTGQLSVCKNQFDSITLIQLWTGFPDYFSIDFQKLLVLLFSQTVETKAGFLWAVAGTWPRCLEIEQSTGCYQFSQGELTVNEMQIFPTSITILQRNTGYFWFCAPGCIWMRESCRSVFVKAACTVQEHILF